MSKVSIILALIILTAYLVYVVGKFGWKKSISHSFYETGWLFQSTLMAVAILTILGTQSDWFVYSGVLLQGVGVFPDFKDKREAVLHSICAYGSGITALIGVFVEFSIVLPFIVALMVVLSRLFVKKNTTYWVEIVAFYLILMILAYFV